MIKSKILLFFWFLLVFLFSSLLFDKKTKETPIFPFIPEEKPATISLIFAGDLGLGREINWQIQSKKDPTFPFQKINNLIRQADIAVANLEGPVIENCPTNRLGFKFCGKPENITGLSFAGFDLVNLANNHIANFGQEGVLATKEILTENRIDYFDKESINYQKVKNLRFAFLGFDDIVRPIDKEVLKNIIKSANENADWVIVNFHWGQEYQDQPNPRQKTLAHLAIDAGADIIIGHHPHVVQPVELYQGKPIFYSLGNFLFDQLWSQKTREGIVAKIIIEGNEIKNTEAIKTFINDNYVVEMVDFNSNLFPLPSSPDRY